MTSRKSNQAQRKDAIDYIKSLDSKEFNQIKNDYIQHFCDFYDEHTDVDKEWFARQFHSCLEPVELYNSCAFIWMIPLFILSRNHKRNTK